MVQSEGARPCTNTNCGYYVIPFRRLFELYQKEPRRRSLLPCALKLGRPRTASSVDPSFCLYSLGYKKRDSSNIQGRPCRPPRCDVHHRNFHRQPRIFRRSTRAPSPSRVVGRAALMRRLLLYDPLPCGAITASITRSRLKLPGFWRGGNSRKLWSHWPTYDAAGAMVNMCSRYQRW